MSLVATESQYKILERINPLQTTLIEQSIVSSRVALLLRSAEIKLLFSRFVFSKHFHGPVSEGNSRRLAYKHAEFGKCAPVNNVP